MTASSKGVVVRGGALVVQCVAPVDLCASLDSPSITVVVCELDTPADARQQFGRGVGQMISIDAISFDVGSIEDGPTFVKSIYDGSIGVIGRFGNGKPGIVWLNGPETGKPDNIGNAAGYFIRAARIKRWTLKALFTMNNLSRAAPF